MKLGPYAIEQDYSQYVSNASQIIFAIVGTATKGPIGEPTVCTSIRDLLAKFGKVNPNCMGLYAANYFLNVSSKIYYVRAATSDAVESSTTISGVNNSTTVNDALTIKSKYKGTYLDSYKLVVTVDANTKDVTFKLCNPAGTAIETISKVKTEDIIGYTDSAKKDPVASSYYTLEYVAANSITAITAGEYTFSGGNDGINGITSSEYITAGNKLSTDNIDMNLFAVPGVSDPEVITSMLTLAETRGDCLFLVDPPADLTPDQVKDWHNGTGDYDHAMFASSYGALYYAWQRIYDSVNGIYVNVPPSVVVAPAIAKSTQISEIWYAPAGLKRGLVNGVVSPAYTPDSGETEDMYADPNAINCIVSDPQAGLCIFGQKTLYRQTTALNRVNVRLLLNYLKRVVVAACRTLTFEPNDRVTWNNFEDLVEPTFKSIKNRRGIYDYRIVKGEAIVTDNDIDNYRMPCMILIRPTKTAEDIPIYFTITNTGADFNDILEANGITIDA